MELRNIKTFLYAADQCSFSKAASLLGYSQSTVTTQIQQLEHELDTQLFDRIHKTVRLTASGQEFLHYAQQILKTTEEARIALKKLPIENGELRIAMAESLCNAFFPEILEAYHQKYPQVELRLITTGTDDMFRMMYHNEVDLVYTLDHRFYSSDLVTVFEKEEEIIFVSSPEHPAASHSHTLAELIGHEFLLTEQNMSYRKHLEELLASRSLEIHPFLELNSTDIIRNLVKKGLGLSFLPQYTVADCIRSGTLTRLSVNEPPFYVWRQLIYHKNKWVTPQMQAMIKLIQQYEF